MGVTSPPVLSGAFHTHHLSAPHETEKEVSEGCNDLPQATDKWRALWSRAVRGDTGL